MTTHGLTVLVAMANPRASGAVPRYLTELWAHRASQAASMGGGVCGSVAATGRRHPIAKDNKPYDGGIEVLHANIMGHLSDATDWLHAPEPSRTTATSLLHAPHPLPLMATDVSSLPSARTAHNR